LSKIPTNKFFSIGFIVMTVVAVGGIAGAGIMWVNHQNLNAEVSILISDFEELFNNYSILTDDYESMEALYNALVSDYNNLQSNYNALTLLHAQLNTAYQALNATYYQLCAWIRQQILPLQVASWAEAVRRVYLPYYLDQSIDDKTFYMKFAEFCRDLVLHASRQTDLFTNVSNAFAPALIYGNNTMQLGYQSMYVMAKDDGATWQKFPSRWGWGFSPELWGLDQVLTEAYTNIDYEYDSDITTYQENPTWDYPKHPVETAFRGLGDCDDQAMFLASYLEECYFFNASGSYPFQVALAVHHDPSYAGSYAPLIGQPFYHVSLLVHIEDIVAYNLAYPLHPLWSLGGADPYSGFTWCWLDPTWDTPFGTKPAWLNGYSMSFATILSIAICDIGGNVV
jgi:hypothetical protein